MNVENLILKWMNKQTTTTAMTLIQAAREYENTIAIVQNTDSAPHISLLLGLSAVKNLIIKMGIKNPNTAPYEV